MIIRVNEPSRSHEMKEKTKYFRAMGMDDRKNYRRLYLCRVRETGRDVYSERLHLWTSPRSNRFHLRPVYVWWSLPQCVLQSEKPTNNLQYAKNIFLRFTIEKIFLYLPARKISYWD